jgi:tRNA G18 (ribose-2'-O)-methylase SpoU
MPVVTIEDPADTRVADYIGLTDAALRRRIELGPAGGTGAGIFIAEGPLVIRRLLRSPYGLRSVLVTPRQLEAMHDDLSTLEVPVFVAAPGVMNAVTGFDIHRGALAAADRRPLPDAGDLLPAVRRVAVLEDINDHENLGAIFRSAAALGVGAVILSPGCCDPLYRRAVRVSMGHVLSVPYTTVHPWPGGLAQIAAAGFRLVALTPSAEAEPIDRLGLQAVDRVALLLGAEDRGLSSAAMAAAAVRARIPMASGIDSLNVAGAAAIAFHAASALP